jgi:hypothetical protein
VGHPRSGRDPRGASRLYGLGLSPRLDPAPDMRSRCVTRRSVPELCGYFGYFHGNFALASFQSSDSAADVLAAVAERVTERDTRQLERVSDAPEFGAGHGGLRNFRCWAASPLEVRKFCRLISVKSRRNLQASLTPPCAHLKASKATNRTNRQMRLTIDRKKPSI